MLSCYLLSLPSLILFLSLPWPLQDWLCWFRKPAHFQGPIPDTRGRQCLLLPFPHPQRHRVLSILSHFLLVLQRPTVSLSPSSFHCQDCCSSSLTGLSSSRYSHHARISLYPLAYSSRQNIKNNSNKNIIAAAATCSDFPLLPLIESFPPSSLSTMSKPHPGTGLSRQCASGLRSCHSFFL